MLEVVLVDDAGLAHFPVEVVALTGALTDPGEHGVTAVLLGDVVDQLHDDDGLADAGTTEGADLAALGERADQVDDLDAGLEDLGRGVLLDQGRRRAVNRVALSRVRPRRARPPASPVTLKMRPRTPSPTGTVIGRTGVGELHAALETFGGRHGDRAHPAVAEVLLHLEGELGRHCRRDRS